jgi:hypothetical protein
MRLRSAALTTVTHDARAAIAECLGAAENDVGVSARRRLHWHGSGSDGRSSGSVESADLNGWAVKIRMRAPRQKSSRPAPGSVRAGENWLGRYSWQDSPKGLRWQDPALEIPSDHRDFRRLSRRVRTSLWSRRTATSTANTHSDRRVSEGPRNSLPRTSAGLRRACESCWPGLSTVRSNRNRGARCGASGDDRRWQVSLEAFAGFKDQRRRGVAYRLQRLR